jgi:hypothetical protein
MITCQSCGAQSNDGALICSACGKPLSQTATPSAAPPAAPTSPQPSRAISPDAEKAMRHAADQARGVVSNLGPEKTTSIAGGVLGLLGALLPFYVIPNVADVLGNGGGTSTSSSLVNQGSEGIIVMLLAVLLGAGPFFAPRSRMFGVAGFGLAAAVLGVLISDRAGLSFFGQSMVPDFGIGWYSAFVGFAVLAWVYWRRSMASA